MDLNTPLGMTPSRRRRRVAPLLGGAAAVVLAGGVVYRLATADPRGGQPFATATLPPPPARPPALDATPTGAIPAASPPGVKQASEPAAPRARTGSLEGGVMVYRGSADSTPGAGASAPSTGPLVIDVTRSLDDPRRRSPDGLPGKGAVVPAAGVPSTPAGAQPRVAIFVSGMGLSDTATRTAIETMPPDISLAFVPYGTKVAASVEAARAKGHEVLLQLPMQNAGGASPGPHALTPGEPPEPLAADLAWAIGRFSGYDGLVNLLGAPVTADAGTMRAVLTTARARDLFYLDDGTSRREVAGGVASDVGVPFAKADVVLDATADPAVVSANLENLVAIARRKGQAIGMASGLPDHLGAIARFASGLGGRGVALVRVGVLARSAPGPVATGR